MPDIPIKAHVSELIQTQHATRHYSQQAVTEEDLRLILNAGRRAQSSNNNQPWYFLVVRDREQLHRLAEGGKYAEHVKNAAFAIALATSHTGGADDFDLGQAAAYLQLAAWDLGIGSCVTWMHHTERTREVLALPPDLSVQVVLSFGYPAPQEATRPRKRGGRKPLEEVVRWERWS